MSGQNPCMPEAAQVQEMFARVAGRYDLANRLLSAGVDGSWRRSTVRIAGVQVGEQVLDVCAGTADLSLSLAAAGARVIGADFCVEMLAAAQPKVAGKSLPLLAADTMQLPFADDSFDLCTVAFGIRNVGSPLAGLREMRRVTRPGGRVVVLEFCKPKVPVLGQCYMFYFRRILPLLGRMISGDKGGAYAYLPESVMSFPERGEFLDLMQEAGLVSPQQRILSCGIAAIYRAEVA